MDFLQSPLLRTGLGAMLGGMILLYAAAQSLSGMLAQRMAQAPARRAMWYGLLIGATAIVATFLGHGEMGLEILTGCAVAALSLAPGVSGVISPAATGEVSGNSSYGLLLGQAMLFWLIGFRAEINWVAGVLLAIQAIIAVWIWRERDLRAGYSAFFWVVLILGIGVTVFASSLAVRGAMRLHEDLNTLTSGVFAAGILAPILILPLLGESVRLAEENRSDEARIAQVGAAMMSLAMIPLCVLVSYMRHYFDSSLVATPLPFAIGTWRIDAVLLVVLAMWNLLGSRLSRGAAKMEGVCLIVVYGAYLISLARMEMYL